MAAGTKGDWGTRHPTAPSTGWGTRRRCNAWYSRWAVIVQINTMDANALNGCQNNTCAKAEDENKAQTHATCHTLFLACHHQQAVQIREGGAGKQTTNDMTQDSARTKLRESGDRGRAH